MGTYVLDEARRRGTPKTVMIGHDLLVPEVHAGAVQRGLALAGLPRGDQRPVRHRQAGPARAGPGQPGAVRPERRLPDADQPLRPGRQVPPRASPTSSPRSSRSASTPRRRGADHIEVWGTGSGQPRVPLRRRRRRGHRARRRALRRRRAGQPRRPTRSCRSASSSSSSPRLVGFDGRDPVGHVQARRPAPPRRRRRPGRERVRLQGRARPSTRACAAPSTGTWPTAARPRPARSDRPSARRAASAR